MLGEFLSAIFDVSVRAGADVRQHPCWCDNCGAQFKSGTGIGRRVLGIKDWNEVCDFIYGLDDHWLEELLQERKRQRSRGQWNTGGPIATAADDDRTTQSYDTVDKWNFSPPRPPVAEADGPAVADGPEADPNQTRTQIRPEAGTLS